MLEYKLSSLRYTKDEREKKNKCDGYTDDVGVAKALSFAYC